MNAQRPPMSSQVTGELAAVDWTPILPECDRVGCLPGSDGLCVYCGDWAAPPLRQVIRVEGFTIGGNLLSWRFWPLDLAPFVYHEVFAAFVEIMTAKLLDIGADLSTLNWSAGWEA